MRYKGFGTVDDTRALVELMTHRSSWWHIDGGHIAKRIAILDDIYIRYMNSKSTWMCLGVQWLQHTAAHSTRNYTTLQHTAPHCTTLHHTAPYCTILQHTWTRLGVASCSWPVFWKDSATPPQNMPPACICEYLNMYIYIHMHMYIYI